MVTTDFYNNVYGGVPSEDIESCLKRAEAIVDCYILYPPKPLTEQEVYYNKAVCAQAEVMVLAGGVQAWLETVSGSAVGVTLGSFHTESSKGVNGSGDAASADAAQCSSAMMFLEKGGLIYRGSAVI